MSGPRLTRAFARNAAESAYPNLWRGLVAAWAPPGAPRHATRLWDYSGNGNHGTLQNGTSWTAGKNGHALKFDGIDDDVIGDTPGKNFPTGNQSRTVCCWIKSSGWTGDRGLLHWGTDGAFPSVPTAANFHLVAGGGGIILWGNGFGDGILNGNTQCMDDRWHSVAGIYESADNLASIYIDGKLDASVSLAKVPNTGAINNWRAAKFLNNAGAFPGKIAQMLVFRRKLTVGEILALSQGANPMQLKHQNYFSALKVKFTSFTSFAN